MSGNHSHTHAHGSASRRLKWALWLTLFYLVVEVVGGLLTGSLALLADAAHMLSDAGALAVALAAARIAERPPDTRQTMGYHRAEVVGAGLNAATLAVLGLWIGVEGIGRLLSPHEVIAGPMMVVAAVGLLVNLFIAWMLHGNAHDLNTRAALLHVLGDALGSVGAMVAGGLMLWKGWFWADSVASLVIACLLLFGATRLLREVVRVLMQAAPAGLDVADLERLIHEIEGVASVHDLHAWSLRPGDDVLTVHVVLGPEAEAVTVCARVREALMEALPRAHVTVQPEPAGESCAEHPVEAGLAEEQRSP